MKLDETTQEPCFLGRHAVCRRYGMSIPTLQRFRNEGSFPLPHMFINRVPLWSIKALEAWEESCKPTPEQVAAHEQAAERKKELLAMADGKNAAQPFSPVVVERKLPKLNLRKGKTRDACAAIPEPAAKLGETSARLKSIFASKANDANGTGKDGRP